MSNSDHKGSATLSILLATLLWSTTSPVVKWAALPALLVAAIRCVVPSILSFFILLFRKQLLIPNKVELFSAFVNAIRMYAFLIALQYTTVQNAIAIAYASPIFSTIFARIILGEMITPFAIFGIGSAFTGVLLIFGHAFSIEGPDGIGVILSFLSAIGFGFANALNKRELSRLKPLNIVFSQNIVGAVLFLPAIYSYGLGFETLKLSAAVYYSIASGFLGYFLYLHGLKKLPVSVASTLCYLEVVFSIAIAHLWLKEELNIFSICGASLIVMGTWLVRRRNSA